jgi:aspartate 1-decarboxylase
LEIATFNRNLNVNQNKFSILRIEVLKSKIHRAKITQAELHYVGSIAIDEDLMDAANLIEGEKVTVVNINNGERLETYVIKGDRGTGMVCLNGPAARKAQVGDIVIIISYATMKFEKAKQFKPTIIFPTPDNKLP